MQVNLLPNNAHNYHQVGQDSDIEWSPLKVAGDNLDQSHPFFRCRDYFNEVVANRADGRLHKQYGFEISWDKDEHPEGTEFLMVTKEFDQIRKGIVEFLNPLEERKGYKKTETFLVGEHKDGREIWRVSADPIWMTSPVLISTYTLALRNFYYYNKNVGNNPSFFGDWKQYYKSLYFNKIPDTQVKEYSKWAPVWIVASVLDNAEDFSFTADQLTRMMDEIDDDNFLHNYCGIVNGTKYLYGETQAEHRRNGGTGNHYTIKSYHHVFKVDDWDIDVILDKLARAPGRTAEQSEAYTKWLDSSDHFRY